MRHLTITILSSYNSPHLDSTLQTTLLFITSSHSTHFTFQTTSTTISLTKSTTLYMKLILFFISFQDPSNDGPWTQNGPWIQYPVQHYTLEKDRNIAPLLYLHRRSN